MLTKSGRDGVTDAVVSMGKFSSRIKCVARINTFALKLCVHLLAISNVCNRKLITWLITSFCLAQEKGFD